MIVLYDENFEVCVDYITSLHTIVMMVIVTIMMAMVRFMMKMQTK